VISVSGAPPREVSRGPLVIVTSCTALISRPPSPPPLEFNLFSKPQVSCKVSGNLVLSTPSASPPPLRLETPALPKNLPLAASFPPSARCGSKRLACPSLVSRHCSPQNFSWWPLAFFLYLSNIPGVSPQANSGKYQSLKETLRTPPFFSPFLPGRMRFSNSFPPPNLVSPHFANL